MSAYPHIPFGAFVRDRTTGFAGGLTAKMTSIDGGPRYLVEPEAKPGAFCVEPTTRERVEAARARGPAALVAIMAERLIYLAARHTQATEVDMIRDGFTVLECATYGTRARTLAVSLTEAAADAARDTAAAEAAEPAQPLAEPFAALDAELVALRRHIASVDTELARLRSGGQG